MAWATNVLLTLLLALLLLLAVIVVATGSSAVRNNTTLERLTSAAPSDAVEWLRAGLLALKFVPSLRLPDFAKSTVMAVETVPVTESRVWLDMCAPLSDGILCLYPVDSLGDLVVNRSHPHAEYLLDYDNKVVSLKTSGRYKASTAFKKSFSEMETRAFPDKRIVDNNTGHGPSTITVYSITPSFPSDMHAAQAVYDFLLSVSLLRTCVTNGSLVDDVLAALADHDLLVSRNTDALAKLTSDTKQDMERLTADNASRLQKARGEMRNKVVTANADVLAAQHNSLDLGRSVSSLTRSKGKMELKTQADTDTLSNNKMKIAQAGAEADYTELQREHADTDLKIVQGQLADYEKSRRDEEASLEAQTLTGVTDTHRGLSNANRLAPVAQASETEASKYTLAHETALHDGVKYKAKLDETNASLQSALTGLKKIEGTIVQSKQSEESKRLQLSKLEAERKQLIGSAKAIKTRTEQEVKAAMDANVDASMSYALWDRYASLTRIQDDIDAMDDGLPQ
jgi:hypothetical protein